MRVQSAPSLQALSEQQDEAVSVSEARGLSIYVSIRKIRGTEHLPEWLAGAGFCHYMLVARERGPGGRTRQFCWSPLDEEKDVAYPWESPSPQAAAVLASAANSPALYFSASPPGSLGSSPRSSLCYSRSTSSLASMTSVASFSSSSLFGADSSAAGDSDDASSSCSSSSSPAFADEGRTKRRARRRRHRNPVPGAVREEDLDGVPAASTFVGETAPGVSLDDVRLLAAAAGRDFPLYELCVNDCRHFVDDLSEALCGARKAVRRASRAYWAEARERERRERERRAGEGSKMASAAVAVEAAAGAAPSDSAAPSFSPLQEQKQKQLLEQEKEGKPATNGPSPRRRRHRGLKTSAGDAAVRAAQLLTDVDNWPAVAAASKALALGALSAAATRPAAALLPCAALSLVLPADVKPAAGAVASAVLRAPAELAGAALRTGGAAAGAALRATAGRLRFRRRRRDESGGAEVVGGIPGLR